MLSAEKKIKFRLFFFDMWGVWFACLFTVSQFNCKMLRVLENLIFCVSLIQA